MPDFEIESGIWAGVSDPKQSSMGKLTCVEDDLGMLWLRPNGIFYRGDSQTLDIRRPQIIDVERKVDSGSMAAYAGAVHIIIHWRDTNEAERQTRLHLEDCWTLTGLARALDELADRIEKWRSTPPPLPPAG